MMILEPFTKHPADVGETYGEHLVQAIGFGARMILAGVACVLHGVFPFLFVKTGSKQIAHLHDRMIANRTKLPDGWSYII